METDDITFNTVDISQFNTHGFCPSYPLRRHKYEALANEGSYQARRDWIQYIGPIAEFGACNPANGNFTALVLPLCRTDRLSLVAYVLEYAFLHDNVVEVLRTEAFTKDSDEFSLGEVERARTDALSGRKQIQARMMLQLTSTDKICAERVVNAWKTMLATTWEGKCKNFASLDEYLNFRIVDTGAPQVVPSGNIMTSSLIRDDRFVESIMLYGMGVSMTNEEDVQLADVIRPCYASLALANDYFSFEREWKEAQRPGAAKPLNAVWLYMKWQEVDIASAKQLVRKAANHYENQFLVLSDKYRSSQAPIQPKLDGYLRALSFQVSGNVVWSLNCPRYHPKYRYDPNEGLEDQLTAEIRELLPLTCCHQLMATGAAGEGCKLITSPSPQSHSSAPTVRSSSATSSTDVDMEAETTKGLTPLGEEKLGFKHLHAPLEYTSSLPSKGVRDMLIDALNVWANLPEDTILGIKEVIGHLHTASLMLDDIEDSSELRRGQPVAHEIFGVPQTINAASFAIVEALMKARELDIPGALEMTLEQLQVLHVGQSYDIYWTHHLSCPSEEEYLEMVSKKTGGLLKLFARLMGSDMRSCVRAAMEDTITLIGIHFQIRDDYQNLLSEEYTGKKGFCEDLDEGKFSFLLVHYFNTERNSAGLRAIMQKRRNRDSLSMPLKRLVLQHLESSGCVEYTLGTLRKLQMQIDGSIQRVEELTGKKNWVLRLCMLKLGI